MKQPLKISLSLISVLILGACASGNCRSQKDSKAERVVDLKQEEAKLTTAASKVKVYKYDGTLQCGQGQKIALDVMAKELKGLTIHSSKNQSDGLMRIQVCGSPTGMANVYEIDRTALPEALNRGFKEWIGD